MAFLLLVTVDTRGERLRELLTTQGWWVSLARDRETALRAAANQEPQVVIVDALLPGARELVKAFSSRNGGPGSIVLCGPDSQHENLALVEAGADELLSAEPRVEELSRAIERIVETPRQVETAEPFVVGRRLTADEIFGDILEEVSGEAANVRGAVLEPDDAPAEVWPPPEAAFADEPDEESGTGSEGAGDDGTPSWWHERSAGEENKRVEDSEGEWFAEAFGEEEGRQQATADEGAGAGQLQASGPSARRDTESPAPRGEDVTGLGQYQLEERVAVGGMAEVWRASMVGLEGFRKTVAIKKILPHLAENEDFVRMFVDEAKLAAQLSHENLVEIYDLGKMDKDFFIAMEFVDGRDLRSILNRLRRRGEQFPLDLALYITAKTAAALDYAHAHTDAAGRPLNLVHRDVSPRNILISHSGNVRLCDFGVAKAVSSVPRTEIGALKGKLHYMSPEQATGAALDSRSDIFSLGGVLFEMVTGRRLFVGDSEISLLEAVRRGKVEDPAKLRADLPPDLTRIIKRALEKSPSKRWATAGDLQREIERTLFQIGEQPSPSSLAEWLAALFREPPTVEVEPQPPLAGVPIVEEAEPAATTSPEPYAVPGSGTRAASGLEPPRRRFWLGIGAGLLLAVLTAVVLAYLLGRL